MINPGKMEGDSATDQDKRPRAEWITSVILIAIWILGLLIVAKTRSGIPQSMLIIGTIFFIVLIPAMKELIRSIERLIDKEVSADPSSRDSGDQKKRTS